jgi:hypothetical protein
MFDRNNLSNMGLGNGALRFLSAMQMTVQRCGNHLPESPLHLRACFDHLLRAMKTTDAKGPEGYVKSVTAPDPVLDRRQGEFP